jgi:hypothetical protein
VSKDKVNVVIGAQIGDPIPAKYAFNADNDVIDKWEYDFKKQFRVGLDILVNPGLSLLIDDTDVHLSCVQVDTAIVLVLLIVEPHVDLLSLG